MLEVLRWVEVVPPFWLVFQIPIKPGNDGFCPPSSMVKIHYEVVLIVEVYHLHGLAQNLECVEHLNAFSRRHIGIGRALKQKQWGFYTVGHKKWTLLNV